MLTFLLLICDEDQKEKLTGLYKKYHSEMIRYAKHHLKIRCAPNSERDAEDVVQNAFLKITRHIGNIRFERGEAAVRAYVFEVVLHEAIAYFEESKARGSMDYDSGVCEEDDFFAQLPIKEAYEQVMAAIEKLDDKYRYTLLLHYTHEMSVKNIAEHMGVPEKTVYTRLARGRKQLLELLEKEGFSYV